MALFRQAHVSRVNNRLQYCNHNQPLQEELTYFRHAYNTPCEHKKSDDDFGLFHRFNLTHFKIYKLIILISVCTT